MKRNWKTGFFALALCLSLLVSCLPVTAFAESAAEEIFMIAGDVMAGFAPAGASCESTDPSVAWVDSNGSLCALKAGTATVTVPGEENSQTDYLVTVSDYSDGSDIVGNLKLLVRYNDNMQFYDGHVYLLFTSYQDGVEISVPDLYGAYEISDEYYEDIRRDISNGSNHTGSDTDKYFTFRDDIDSVNVDRGEIVTIGMYRGFDLSVAQAVIGSIKNSSLWTELERTGKSVVVEKILSFLDSGNIDAGEAVERIKAVVEEAGLDYNKLMDGVVEGGVCFNRELYNQKLEWDQYENVTYDLDITRNQLNMMSMYLRGNLNKFSILKNSCATVALRAWNAAVGSRDGADTAYKLSSEAGGIYSFIDAPKGVRDNIVSSLPGYYLNNAEGVAEPGAGYQDDTGWVYVSAPKDVEPVVCVYADDSVQIDESKTKLSDLINAAKGDKIVSYNKDEQEIGVSVMTEPHGDDTAILGVQFDINGETLSLDSFDELEKGVWFNVRVDAPAEGESYYAVGSDGKALPSEYADGRLSFFMSAPSSFKIIGGSEGTRNLLNIVFKDGGKVVYDTEVYAKNGDEKVVLNSMDEVAGGTKIFIAPKIGFEDKDHIVTDITFNGESVYNKDNYDAEEGAYFAIMPDKYSDLTVESGSAVINYLKPMIAQVAVGDVLNIADYAELVVDGETAAPDHLCWEKVISDTADSIEIDGDEIRILKPGSNAIWIYAESNDEIGIPLVIRSYDTLEDMVMVRLVKTDKKDVAVMTEYNGQSSEIPTSEYLVKKGTVLSFLPTVTESKQIFYIVANEDYLYLGETFTVTEDTDIEVKFAAAEIKGMPEEIRLADKDDTYQLEPKVRYSGVLGLILPFDESITYASSDPLISVDRTGLITVAGEVPEDGAAAYITAYAGSTNNMVKAVTRITVGDYAGDKIVGRLTLSSRRIGKEEFIPHGALTFTTYEDLDMPVSYYEYYKPNDKYNELMMDYELHPENYSSDPALCNDNELGLEDRESYFDIYNNGAESEPRMISLSAGESFTVSNYGFDPTNITAVRRAVENGAISSSKDAQEFARQLRLYENGEEYDGKAIFDSFISTFFRIYAVTNMTGYNPADGHSEGGQCLNREIYNQFRRNDTQFPNSYYTVEITADELAAMKAYLADPSNNYYSLLVKNCGSGVVGIWNTTLFDRPELHVTANLTGLFSDPESLYFSVAKLALTPCLDGEGGTNFCPRTVRYSDAAKDAIEKIAAIGEMGDDIEAWKDRIDAAREAYDALNDVQKDRVWNYDDLVKAEQDYEAVSDALNKEAFDDYKQAQLEAADAMLKEGDSEACGVIAEVAKAIISAMEYDESKTLEENKADVDMVIAALEQALERQRMIDDPILGDADSDGAVTIADATAIQRKAAFIPTPFVITAKTADVDGDGAITVVDATYLQRWTVGLPSNDNIGKHASEIVPAE